MDANEVIEACRKDYPAAMRDPEVQRGIQRHAKEIVGIIPMTLTEKVFLVGLLVCWTVIIAGACLYALRGSV